MSTPDLPALLDAKGNPVKRFSAFGGGDTSYDAAATRGELRNWTPFAGSADSEISGEIDTLIARGRDADRNQSMPRAMLSTELLNVIGTGLKVLPRPDYRALGKTKEWADEWSQIVKSKVDAYFASTDCDAAGIDDFYGLQALVFASTFISGGVLALPIWREDSKPQRATKYRTAFKLVEIDRLSNKDNAMDTEFQRGGITIDKDGEPVSYSILKSHPGDAFIGAARFEWEERAAYTAWGRALVLHVFSRDRIDQHRGVPTLAGVLADLKIGDNYRTAEMQAAVANAVVALVAQSPLAPELVKDLFGSYEEYLSVRAKHKASLKPGSIVGLFPGDTLAGFTAARPNANYGPFMDSVMRPATAANGLPMEMVLKNFSTMNYSGQRQMIIDADRTFANRERFMKRRFCSPAYELIFEEMVDSGDVPDCSTDDLLENWQAWTRSDWLGEGNDWVDPKNEVEADHMKIAYGFSTLEAVSAAKGRNWRDDADQQAVERAHYAKLGIPYPGHVDPLKTTVTVREEETKPGDTIRDRNDRQETPNG